MTRFSWIKRVFLGIALVLADIIFGLAQAPYALGAPADSLPVSKGVYRLPYENGQEVRITSDHTNHPTQLNRLDMRGQGGGPYTVVAAGAGTLRRIQDQNDTFCPLATMNNPNPCDGYSGSSENCCERNDTSCNSTCANNFIWIEHPNGEWTKYSHIRTNSALDLGLSEGKFVSAGTAIGLEGDVGIARGPHVHFEVAVPNDPDDPFIAGGFLKDDGDPSTTDYNRQNRIPVFCDIDFPVTDGDEYTAANCQRDCAAVVSAGSGVNDNQVRHRQADDRVQTISGMTHVVESGGGEALRAGEQVILFPGFRAEPRSYFSASIGSCDRPGAT